VLRGEKRQAFLEVEFVDQVATDQAAGMLFSQRIVWNHQGADPSRSYPWLTLRGSSHVWRMFRKTRSPVFELGVAPEHVTRVVGGKLYAGLHQW
jgi:hypothetical protein